MKPLPLRRLVVVSALLTMIGTASLTRIMLDNSLFGGRMCFAVSTLDPDELDGLLQERRR